MEMTDEIRKQLMEMSGIQDVAEFEKMVNQFAPKSNAAMKKPVAGETSPFQVHFVKLITMVESAGIQNFMNLDRNIEKEIEHVFKIINTEYADIRVALPEVIESKENTIDKIENSKTYRDRGNKAYAKKDLNAAMAFYCKAIVCAPLDPDGRGREVSLSLGNRSAVFFEMAEWKKCLADIEASFLFGYPDDLVYKLYERKGNCLFQFHGYPSSSAIDSISKAIETVNVSKMNEVKKEEFIQKLKSQLEEWKSIKVDAKKRKETENFDYDDFECPFTIWDRHPTFPPLSDSIDIAYDDEVGRYVIARKNIRAGEAVVIEEPVAAHLSRSFADTNCVQCLRKCGQTVLPSPIVPDKCKFCSLRCLKIAMDTYHKVESKISIAELFYAKDESEKQQQMSGCISLAYRAVTQKGLKFFLQNREKLFTFHDTKFGVNTDPKFSYTGDEHYRGLFNLVNHNEHMGDLDRIKFIIRTVVLLKCLQGSGFFGEDIAKRSVLKETISEYHLSEEEIYIGRLLFHFQTGIQYNLHAVYQVDEQRMEAGKRIPLTDIGAGVYPTTIFFNHSCAPNTVRINMGKRVVYVAKRNIAAGEQVTDCYGIHHLSLPLAERQSLLTRGYVFKCLCEACEKDFPVLEKLNAKVSPDVALKLGNSFTKYKNLFGEEKYQKALSVCQEYLCRLEELQLPFPHRNYEIAAIALCSCLWAIAGTAAHLSPKKNAL